MPNPRRVEHKVRIPCWAARPAEVSLNGGHVESLAEAGAFASIKRTWTDGDTLICRFPMSLRTESMPDDEKLVAFLYGPLVLAAVTDEELTVTSEEIAALLRKSPASNFTIRLKGGVEASLKPLNEIVDEAFGAYFRLEA